MHDLIYPNESYAIVGAMMEVYNTLGTGYTEYVYQDALSIEFRLRGVEFQQEVPLRVSYKSQILKHTYLADFVCFDNIIIEVKAVSILTSEHKAQLLNYLKVSGLRLGFLVSFATPEFGYCRYVN